VAAGAAALLASPVFVDMALQPMSDGDVLDGARGLVRVAREPECDVGGTRRGNALLTRPPPVLAAALMLVTP